MMKGETGRAVVFILASMLASPAAAQQHTLALTRDNSTVVLEPYAPNIIRVILSLQKDQAAAAPGFGFGAHAAAEGWNSAHSDAGDVYRSSRMVVTVEANHPANPSRTERDIAKFLTDQRLPRTSPSAHRVERNCWK